MVKVNRGLYCYIIMSQIVPIYRTVEINCPHCHAPNELDDIDVSMTIDNTDIMRHKDECEFDHECDECGKFFTVAPVLDIGVTKAI